MDQLQSQPTSVQDKTHSRVFISTQQPDEQHFQRDVCFSDLSVRRERGVAVGPRFP